MLACFEIVHTKMNQKYFFEISSFEIFGMIFGLFGEKGSVVYFIVVP